ncbi:hypothetical protein OIU74_012552, partial [Salix koriyanagi]
MRLQCFSFLQQLLQAIAFSNAFAAIFFLPGQGITECALIYIFASLIGMMCFI